MRYSTIVYGLAAGLMAVAAVGLVSTVMGWPVNYRALGFLFGLCVGAVVFTEWLLSVAGERMVDALHRREREMALAEREYRLQDAAAPRPIVPVTVPYTRDGSTSTLTLRTEERSAKWAAWQTAMELLMAWIDDGQGRITSTALVGRERAFSRVQHWQAAVDQLAAQGWAVPREAGDTTRLTVTRGKLRALILSGRVEWDTATEAPPTLPCPTAAASRVVIEAEKVNS